jgi:hypothetical protein
MAEVGRKRKLKVLVITMGEPRQEKIEKLFEEPQMAIDFEKPTFSPGVPQRNLRNRYEFLKVANEAGLLPKQEWDAIQNAVDDGTYENQHSERWESNQSWSKCIGLFICTPYCYEEVN